MKWLENITGGYSSSAKVVNETLVLSLPDAKSPIVWRMELSEIKAAAFELEEKDDDYVLLMKTPKGDSQQIAPFEGRAKALKALMLASKAMEQAERSASDATTTLGTATPSKKSRTGQAAAGLVGVLILGGLLFVLSQVGPQSSKIAGSSVATAVGGQTTTGGTAGVPMAADDFLMQR